MHTTHTPFGLHWPIADHDTAARLSWLVNRNAVDEIRRSRAGLDEQIMMMRHPVFIQRAYAQFGMLLGTLPPAAIFYKMFWRELSYQKPFMLLLVMAMLVACCFAGRFFGSKLSTMAGGVKRRSWTKEIFTALLTGWLWGIGTGAAGGLVFFGFGAIFGVLCAIPVGLLAFALFMPLHRLLAHGGMIEARHLWPLACGVTMTVSALILGL